MNSSELKGYLTGLIFGDARIDNGVTKRAIRMRSINKDFVEKIKSDIESCTNFEVVINYNQGKWANGCNHKDNWELYIKAHPYFAKKYHHFYDDYKHRIASKEALSWLTPNGLANWYMSDGYVCLVGKNSGNIRSRRIDICTDRYSIDTVQKMSNMLKGRFNIDTSIIKRDKFRRLRISQSSYETFINLVKPYMVNSMMYKLYLGYEQQPVWMSNDNWNLQMNLLSAITLTCNDEG